MNLRNIQKSSFPCLLRGRLCEGSNPFEFNGLWIPAFAGMTKYFFRCFMLFLVPTLCVGMPDLIEKNRCVWKCLIIFKQVLGRLVLSLRSPTYKLFKPFIVGLHSSAQPTIWFSYSIIPSSQAPETANIENYVIPAKAVIQKLLVLLFLCLYALCGIKTKNTSLVPTLCVGMPDLIEKNRCVWKCLIIFKQVLGRLVLSLRSPTYKLFKPFIVGLHSSAQPTIWFSYSIIPSSQAPETANIENYVIPAKAVIQKLLVLLFSCLYALRGIKTKNTSLVPTLCVGMPDLIEKNHCVWKCLTIKKIAILITILFAFTSISYADSPTKPSVSKSTYNILIKAEKLNSEKKHTDAIAILNKHILKLDNENYDKALALKLLAYSYVQANKKQKSINAFEQAIAAKALSNNQRLMLKRQISSLYIEQNSYKKALQHMLDILKQPQATKSEDYLMCGYIYIQQKKPEKALPYINLALEKNRKPQISWLQIKVAALYELKKYNQAADTVINILAIKPQKPETYWRQLASFYALSHKKKRSLAITEIINKLEFTKDKKDYLYLASLLNHNNLPYSAAAFLEVAVAKNIISKDNSLIKKIGDYWWTAREYKKAIATYKTLPIKNRRYSEITKRVSETLFLQREWKNALFWLDIYAKNCSRKEVSIILYRIADCYKNLKEYSKASTSLYKALDYASDEKQRELILSAISEVQNR